MHWKNRAKVLALAKKNFQIFINQMINNIN